MLYFRDGYPSARFVLLKGYSKKVSYFSHTIVVGKDNSREEIRELLLTFYWEHYSRSVRIEGDVEKLPFEDADQYFRNRPYRVRLELYVVIKANRI
ncbi:unnamed protein product [Acanthoscelides obtectus]|uniref:pyridoxal 5'-phosphate synthase n=1 Tax=Acanthoscelides obtectus TaxID=200917 RepID=A0A9P0QHG3_ACAOB|nr:unnamed protein product [Acanthoscelides obtectus]CAK1683477.1 Pyridoxine/pyridoxamine 5'-phosphate oxidase [Acanthoscelides obtectus]